ncbi:hypothetical protein SP90_07580 [Halodesulfovibrio spirochaetisodalis]|uniref:Uncharacterized protein n=1 Tax=Halodesulfovibrio spirochaetisodalis TaxID=1560234 RepID=A0A1B7XE46_9BACT|nr:hypothetical protein SP90_07580 [Halodesulfovibrio spirochaetisodalis]
MLYYAYMMQNLPITSGKRFYEARWGIVKASGRFCILKLTVGQLGGKPVEANASSGLGGIVLQGLYRKLNRYASFGFAGKSLDL